MTKLKCQIKPKIQKFKVLNVKRLLKKSFFSQTRSWANKSKILSAGLPVPACRRAGADRLA